MVIGADNVSIERELADQFERPGLLRDEAIGSGFDEATVHRFGMDHAAQPRRLFDEDAFALVAGTVVSGGQSGNAAADDGDAAHLIFSFANSARHWMNSGESFSDSGL